MTRLFMGVGIIVGKPWWNCLKLLLVMVIFFFRNVIIVSVVHTVWRLNFKNPLQLLRDLIVLTKVT